MCTVLNIILSIMYARPQKRKNYSDIARQAASAASTKKKGPDAISSKGRETSSAGEESDDKDRVTSGLVASLSLTFNGTSSSQDPDRPFLRRKNRPAEKRPFSSMALCASEVKANAERRSLVGVWSSSNFGEFECSVLANPNRFWLLFSFVTAFMLVIFNSPFPIFVSCCLSVLFSSIRTHNNGCLNTALCACSYIRSVACTCPLTSLFLETPSFFL